MKKVLVKSLMHDLLHLGMDFHPLEHFSNVENLELDLLSGKIIYPDEDSVLDFYKKKGVWFKDRVKVLNGESDFQKAKVIVSGRKESVEIVFKNQSFSDELVFGEAAIPASYLETQRLRQKIRELKPSCDVSKK